MKRFFQDFTERKTAVLSSSRRATHTYIVGQPGTGKSKAIESWVMQDVEAGRGVGVIDPHGDLFTNLIARISSMPGVWDKVLIIDPTDRKWVVGFNPLAPIPGVPQERIALHLTDVITKLWNINPTSAPRMYWLLLNSFMALSELRLTLIDLPRLLVEKDFRQECVHHLHNQNTRSYFQNEFPQTPGAINQWITPVLNKIGGLLFSPDIRPMFEFDMRIDFRKILDNNFILLANLPKGILGDNISSLIAAFIVVRIQQAALSRANIHRRKPFYLYLDEFQNYTTDNIENILTESRKFALSLILAHQYLDQLPQGISSAVRNTSGTMICFRIGYQDANRLSKDIFPSADFLAFSKTKISIGHGGLLPRVKVGQIIENGSWEGLTQALTKLQHREFWCRQRGSSAPTKHRTIFSPNPLNSKGITKRMKKLVDYSGQRFGRLRYSSNENRGNNRKEKYGELNTFWGK